jgi:uncharacterized membrane protein YdjX (TVP38/TMEM64 family)
MSPRVVRSGVMGLLAVGIGLAWWTHDQWTVEAITAWVERLGLWGPLGFVGVYGLAPALFFPGAVLTLAGGALFGPFAGALLSLTGATVGATVAFLLARSLAADRVERRLGPRMHAIQAGVEREGWRFVAFVRLVPVFPFNLLNYALGLTRVSVRTFAVTSFLTMAPGALAYAYLGYAGREAIGGGPALVQKGLLALTLLAAVALLPALIRTARRTARRGCASHPGGPGGIWEPLRDGKRWRTPDEEENYAHRVPDHSRSDVGTWLHALPGDGDGGSRDGNPQRSHMGRGPFLAPRRQSGRH